MQNKFEFILQANALVLCGLSSCALCYAKVRPGRKSACRPGFWPDCCPGRPSAGRRADFGVFPAAVRPKSGPEGRFPERKHYCVTGPVGGKATVRAAFAAVALLRNIEYYTRGPRVSPGSPGVPASRRRRLVVPRSSEPAGDGDGDIEPISGHCGPQDPGTLGTRRWH